MGPLEIKRDPLSMLLDHPRYRYRFGLYVGQLGSHTSHWGRLMTRISCFSWDQTYHGLEQYFPKQCGHTEGVLTVRVKARCSFEVASPMSGQFPVNFHTKWLLWNVHVHFYCAGSHKTMSPEVSSAIFPLNFHAKCLLWHVHAHFDCAGPHKTGNLAQTSCQETSHRELVQRSCQETSYGDLVQRSCQETSYRDLANRAI